MRRAQHPRQFGGVERQLFCRCHQVLMVVASEVRRRLQWPPVSILTSRRDYAAGHTNTHLDSLAHFFWAGKMYNGRPAHLVSTSLGATVESVEVAKDGIITRGVLVDVPMIRGTNWVERGEGVMPQDIEEAERRCGFRVEEGDILMVRTGQLHRRNQEGPVDPSVAGSTACQAACLPLFHQRGIAMICSDTGNDV